MEKTKRARKGSGRVYQPHYARAGEQLLGGWRVRYTWRGKRYDEKMPEGWPNTKTGAQNFLKKRYAEQSSGEFSITKGAKELSYEQLRDGLLDYYELNGMKTLKVARDKKTRYVSGQSHVDRYFKRRRALDITSDEVDKFARERKRSGASNSNINSSLGLLRQMFTVAVEKNRLSRGDVPKVKMFDAALPRKGFLEPRDFPKLCDAMPADLRPVLTLGFDTGMRLGEVRRLRWVSVDLFAGEIHLTAEETKTEAPRTIPLGRTLEVFRRVRSERPGDEYVFGGEKPLGSFRKRWNAACVKAGLGSFLCAACSKPVDEHTCDSKKRKYSGLTFHDLRRSAVRNLVRGGTQEGVAMAITGHKTRAVFDRYDIKSTRDLHEAARRTNDYVEHSIGETQGKLESPTEKTGNDEKSLIQ
jgi:integrase